MIERRHNLFYSKYVLNVLLQSEVERLTKSRQRVFSLYNHVRFERGGKGGGGRGGGVEIFFFLNAKIYLF